VRSAAMAVPSALVVLIIAVLLIGHLVQRRRVAGASPIRQAPPRLVFQRLARYDTKRLAEQKAQGNKMTAWRRARAKGDVIHRVFQVTRASALEDAGTRLGRLFHLPLGRCEGRLQVGSDLGHDLLGAADPRLPAACTASSTLAAPGSTCQPNGDLVPGDLFVHGDGHGAPPIGG
jgi:hypothetical protein